MNESSELNSYWAAERTLLAWVRTGLAMMGFGFVVARFGLFLREFSKLGAGTAIKPGLSLAIGTTLVALGVIANLIAAGQHLRLLRALRRGEAPSIPRWPLAVIVAVLLAAIGLGMALYLLIQGS